MRVTQCSLGGDTGGHGGLTSFAAAASVPRQAQTGELGSVLHARPSVQAGVGDTATCKAHPAELGDLWAVSQCPTAA